MSRSHVPDQKTQQILNVQQTSSSSHGSFPLLCICFILHSVKVALPRASWFWGKPSKTVFQWHLRDIFPYSSHNKVLLSWPSALSPGHMLTIREKTSPSMVKLQEFGMLSERPFTCCATQLVQSKNGCSEPSSHASHRLYDKLQTVRNSTQNPSRWDVTLTIRCDPTVVLSVSFISKVPKVICWEFSPPWLNPETPCSDIYFHDHDWFSISYMCYLEELFRLFSLLTCM